MQPTELNLSESKGIRINVGGPFENKEFMYYRIPVQLFAIDTSPGWTQQGQKILINGKVFAQDGITPASGVILYYYHTNTDGKYLHQPEENRSMPPNVLGQTHGYIRGWVKTDSSGFYTICTVRPAAYPTFDEPEHIHLNIKEPNNLSEYYIDDFMFDDDTLLTLQKRNEMKNRGGNGVLKMIKNGEVMIGIRNITLGLNIPDYPKDNL